MRFISRLLFSWTFFLFLVVQHLADVLDDVDVDVAKGILPFLPLVLTVATFTYLVQDTILSQPLPDASFELNTSNPVNWAKSGTMATTGAPIATLTPLGLGVIDKPQASTWSGIFGGYLPLVFLAVVISFLLIVRFTSRRAVARHRPNLSPPPLSATIRRISGFSTAHRDGTTLLVPESQPTAFTCSSYVPYIPSAKKSESAATTATLHQILPCDQALVLSPPPPGEDNPTRSPGPDQNIDQLLPLLNWNFTSSSAFGDEDDVGVFDDDYDEDLWWNAEDDETIQLKEVSRGVVPFPSPAEHEAEEDEDVVQLTSTPAPTFGPGIRPLIPTGQLNPNIESLEIRSNQEAIGFPSSDDEEDEATAPTSPPAPRGKPRIRLQVPAEKPRPTIELLQSRPGHNSIPFPSREGEDGDDDDDDQALRQRRPSFTRPSRPLPPTPTAWRSSSLGRMHGPTPLPVCLEEEEEEEESDQDQLPLPTSNPSPDTSTSSTSTAVEPYTNASGKPSAMKKVKGPRKMATVSFLHFKEVRDLPVTICDWKSRRRFVSEEEEELDVEHRMLENLSGSEVEEAEEVTWLPLEQSVPQSQPSLLSPGGEPQNHAAVERASRGTRLRKMLTKMSPLRFGKRLFKKKTGPL